VDWKDKWPDTCSTLKVAGAWSLQNNYVWTAYANEREKIRRSLVGMDVEACGLECKFRAATAALPGGAEGLMQEVNEVYLLHSPAVDSIACIVEQGLNERFAGASAGSLFGAGLYFAENAGKTDQYATRMSGDSLHLHGLLNPEQSESAQHRDLFYVLVCRVTLGKFVTTQKKDSTLFATRHQRELRTIPGSEPSQPYHSLVARVCDHGVSSTGGCPHGCALRPGRFNEFVSFHDCRAYPEYLVAYRRE